MPPTVTRCIRLTHEESDAIKALAEREAATEATMTKRLLREGLRSRLLESAVSAYCAGQVSIGEAAEMAGLPYVAFFEELRRRHIAVLDESANLAGELADLAERFQNERLAQAGAAINSQR